MDLRQVVGKNVKFWRHKRGLSQEQLAFESDLHRTYVSAVERGIRNPTIETLGKLADALEVRPLFLLYDDDPANDATLLGRETD